MDTYLPDTPLAMIEMKETLVYQTHNEKVDSYSFKKCLISRIKETLVRQIKQFTYQTPP